MVKEDPALQNLSREEADELINDLQEYRALNARGARINNRAAAADVRVTMDHIQNEVRLLLLVSDPYNQPLCILYSSFRSAIVAGLSLFASWSKAMRTTPWYPVSPLTIDPYSLSVKCLEWTTPNYFKNSKPGL